MVSVKLSDSALHDFERIDPTITKRIIAKLMWLEANFTNVTLEPLHYNLKGLYKMRVGDYRIEYSVQDNIILIQAIGHRRDIYR